MPPYTSTSIWPQPSGVVDCTDGFTDSAGESVCAPTMRQTRVLGDRLGHEPRGHRATAHHHVTARGCVPRALLVDARKPSVDQALSHDLGRVIGGGRIKKEMLIVHRVRVDFVQFKLCHTPMVGRSRAAMLAS